MQPIQQPSALEIVTRAAYPGKGYCWNNPTSCNMPLDGGSGYGFQVMVGKASISYRRDDSR